MTTKTEILVFFRKISAVFAMLLLVFMTISAPLTLHQQEEQAQSIALNEETTSTPVSGMNEDSSNTGFSEYLHDPSGMVQLSSDNLKHTTFATDSLFDICNGRLLSPPPEC